MQKKQVRQRTRRSFVLKQQRFKDKKTDDDPYGQKKHFIIRSRLMTKRMAKGMIKTMEK
ncbi:hypothetical protein B4135_3500 [Caldibacillus debilis]|uniref:Uncharacterized protein n=1 Tax=Caldibacillus debilis TaxID=301148 RepID=A0A150LDK5_9BACI|nr:hypothetical protein B4135_3500 [Caldibacillus debilis]